MDLRAPFELGDLVELVDSGEPKGTPLDRLSRSVILADYIDVLGDQLIAHFVDQARENGASWSDIGDALGVSKQAVQKRFVARRAPGDSQGLFTRFDDEARRIVIDAMERARDMGAAEVNTGHLVLALIENPNGWACHALVSLGVPPPEILRSITTELGPAQTDSPRHIPWAAEAKKALELSLRETIRMQAGRIGPKQLLLGLLRDPKSIGGSVLIRLGINRKAIETSA